MTENFRKKKPKLKKDVHIRNVIIFKKGTTPGIFFNKEYICINDIDILKEDLEIYLSNAITEKKVNKIKIDYSKYKNTPKELIKISEIWLNRVTAVKKGSKIRTKPLTL